MTPAAAHDEEPLDVGKLAAEQFEQRLSPVRAELLEMARQNGNFLGPDQLAELIRRASEIGVEREKAEAYLRSFIQKNGIHLGMSDGIVPPPPVAPAGPTPQEAAAAGPVKAKWCPQCSLEAAAEDQFCGKCALQLCCPRCRRDFQLGKRYCTGCGLDPVSYRQLQTHLDAGRRLYQSARTAPTVGDRLRFAEQAVQTIDKALACYAEDLPAHSLAADIRQFTTHLLWEACDTARRDRQLSRAVALLERLSLVPSEAARAHAQRQELRAGREKQLAEAKNEAVSGKWERAVQLLTELGQGFPEDAEIQRLCAEHQEKAALIQDVARNQIPRLQQAKQYGAILKICADLQSRQVNLAWLASAVETCQKRIEQADEWTERANQLLRTGRLPEALTATEKALEVAADHAPALALQGILQEKNKVRQHWQSRLDQARAAQRWFLADLALGKVNGAGGKDVLPQESFDVQAGMESANQFLRFVAWTIAGGLLLWLAAHMATVLENELAHWLPERLFGWTFFSRLLVQKAAFVTALAVLPYLMLTFLLACFGQPLDFPAAAGGLGRVFAAVGPGSLLWSVWTYYVCDDMQSIGEGLLRGLGTLLLAAGLGALLGLIALTQLVKVLRVAADPFALRHRKVLLAGSVAACLCLAGLSYPRFLLADVPAAVFLFGLLTLAGLVISSQLYLLILAAIISSGAAAAITAGGLREGHWLAWTASCVLLTAAGFFISPARRWPRDAVHSFVLVVVALAALRLLSASLGACVLVSTWVFVCGAIAEQLFPAVTDRRLHLLDRWRVWSDRKTA